MSCRSAAFKYPIVSLAALVLSTIARTAGGMGTGCEQQGVSSEKTRGPIGSPIDWVEARKMVARATVIVFSILPDISHGAAMDDTPAAFAVECQMHRLDFPRPQRLGSSHLHGPRKQTSDRRAQLVLLYISSALSAGAPASSPASFTSRHEEIRAGGTPALRRGDARNACNMQSHGLELAVVDFL